MRQGCVCLTHCCVFRSLPAASTKYVFCHHLLDEWIHLLINLWQAYCSVCVCMHAKLLQSCLTLCDYMDYSLPGSSVRGLQARILEWTAMPFSRDLTNPGIKHVSLISPALAGRFFSTSGAWEALVFGDSESVSCSVTCNSLWPHRLLPTKPGKNTGVGCHFLLVLGTGMQRGKMGSLSLSSWWSF